MLARTSNDLIESICNLTPSINQIKKEDRRLELAAIQKRIDTEAGNLFDDQEVVDELNINLQSKNCLLTKDASGRWVLLDRENTFEKSYESRFKHFLESSNDKIKCIEALAHLMKLLVDIDTTTDEDGKKLIQLLDIGAGDGTPGLSLLSQFKSTINTKYIAVERDKHFVPLIKDKFQAAQIPHEVYGEDFRKILDTLSKTKSTIALASHLYTTTPMHEFFNMVFDLLHENGTLIMAHDSNASDAITFRCQFNGLLKAGNRDCTQDIAAALEKDELRAITIPYESTLSFPRVSEEEWAQLNQIKQADYTNTYAEVYSPNLLKLKALIEFVISDKLEAFSTSERSSILEKMKSTLEEKDYQFTSICQIQVALSPKNTLRHLSRFLVLKESIENKPVVAKPSTTANTMFQVKNPAAQHTRADETLLNLSSFVKK